MFNSKNSGYWVPIQAYKCEFCGSLTSHPNQRCRFCGAMLQIQPKKRAKKPTF